MSGPALDKRFIRVYDVELLPFWFAWSWPAIHCLPCGGDIDRDLMAYSIWFSVGTLCHWMEGIIYHLLFTRNLSDFIIQKLHIKQSFRICVDQCIFRWKMKIVFGFDALFELFQESI